MSSRRNSFGSRPTSLGPQLPSHKYPDDSEIDLATRNDASLSILPELMRSIRKLLPQEIPLNMSVRHVEYIENRCERLVGSLFLTTFRLVFAPEKEPTENDFIISGNKYISEFDIPLTSIYKIHVAPVDTRSGFKSFLNENQIQSETRTFTVITRDFRSVTFTKCLVTKSNNGVKNPSVSVTNMETYINAVRRHSRFQSKEQLYPYLAIHQNSTDRATHDQTFSTVTSRRSLEDMTKDFSLSDDERIKSYLTYYDWKDELQEANEQQWIVDRKKFNNQHIVQADGPYVRLVQNNGDERPHDLIWHWAHTSEVMHDRLGRTQSRRHMLVTVPGIGEVASIEPPDSPPATTTGSSSFRFRSLKMKLPKPLRSNATDGPKLICTNESKTTTSGLPPRSEVVPDVGLRRATTDTNLVSSSHYIYDQPFQRYNLAKFPCNLKRLQTSYEKLIEICVIASDDDDDKWWTKLGTCKWLKYVSKTLRSAASLAKLLDYKNIELAGSDTDNNCLMSSLIQILLRPKCRTIKGFCELIVREWLIRGHKFRERFGLLLHDASGHHAQESPVFLLFLDCVYQLLLQNSSAFEFTEYLLLELYRNVCYCYHHTFVFNDVSERLYAMSHCPKNLLVLSSFDFSLYLYPDACYLLRNDTAVFHSQPTTASHQPIKSRVDSTAYSLPTASPQRSPRTVSYLERPNSVAVTSDIPIRSESFIAAAEHFEYETIESPQSFLGDLHVDWRMTNLALWSKCYCRYDQPYRPTSSEEQLSRDVNYLKEKIETAVRQSQQSITLDTHQQIGHANSWHPQALDTRV